MTLLTTATLIPMGAGNPKRFFGHAIEEQCPQFLLPVCHQSLV